MISNRRQKAPEEVGESVAEITSDRKTLDDDFRTLFLHIRTNSLIDYYIDLRVKYYCIYYITCATKVNFVG